MPTHGLAHFYALSCAINAPVKQSLVRLLPGLIVSLGFTVWFFGRAHWSELGGALAGVHVEWVLISAGILYTEFLIRSLRWGVLLRPLNVSAPFHRLFVATVIGMSMNVVLPFRAGDIARPWLGARETRSSPIPLVTIAVLERIFDILGLFSVFVLMVFLLPENGEAQGELVSNLKRYGSMVGVMGGIGMVTFWILAIQADRARILFLGLIRFLPAPIRNKLLGLYDGLSYGLACVRSPRALVLGATLSMIHWVNGSLSIFALFQAFNIDLPYSAACFTTVAIALAAALPQAPGFFGVFHMATENTLTLWGLDPAPAQAFAIVFWGVSFLPITTTGALLFWREGLKLADLRAPVAQPGMQQSGS